MTVSNPSIKVTQAELFMRLAECGNCSPLSERIGSIISEVLEKGKREKLFTWETYLDQDAHHELFIYPDEKSASMLLEQDDSFDKVYSRVMSLFDRGLDAIYIPFAGGRETVLIRQQDILKGRGGMILASGFFSDKIDTTLGEIR